MQVRHVVIGLLVAGVLAPLALAGPADAVKAYDEGKALLAQGNFDGALASFKTAAQADPENKTYFQEAALLRRVINLRKQLETEEDAEIWGKMGRGLCNYYRQYKVRGEALELAGKLYDRMGCGDSAARLAEAQLDLNKNAAAAELLGGLDETKRTPRTNILHGVALARLGKLEDAKACATKAELHKQCPVKGCPAEGCDLQVCYDAARLCALVGDSEKALAMLKCTFEGTPAPWLDDTKSEAKECSDFSSLADSAAFAKVLETKSQVKAGCAGSKGCGKTCTKGKAGCAQSKDKGCEGHKEGKKDDDRK